MYEKNFRFYNSSKHDYFQNSDFLVIFLLELKAQIETEQKIQISKSCHLLFEITVNGKLKLFTFL